MGLLRAISKQTRANKKAFEILKSVFVQLIHLSQIFPSRCFLKPKRSSQRFLLLGQLKHAEVSNAHCLSVEMGNSCSLQCCWTVTD